MKLARVLFISVLCIALAGCTPGVSASPSSAPASTGLDSTGTPPAVASAMLTVTDGTITKELGLTDLQALGKIEARFQNDKGEFEGIGASLPAVLAAADFESVQEVKAVATDGFVTVYSANLIPNVVVAYANASGDPLTDAEKGPFRLVFSEGEGNQNPYMVTRLEVTK